MIKLSAVRPLSAAVLAVVLAVPAWAQSGSGDPDQSAKTDWSRAKLEAFAEATVAMSDVRAEWRPRIADAGTPEERQELREQANAAVQKALEAEDLTPKEYHRIYEATQADEDLHDTVMELLLEARRDEG